MAARAATIPSVLTLQGVGPALATKLQRLGLCDVRDLLLHAPSRYEDRRQVMPIADARCDKVLIEGEAVSTTIVGRRRPILLCRLRDDSGELDLCFFHFHAGLRHRLTPGSRWRCYGEVRPSRYGQKARDEGFEMVHPELEPADRATAGILPIYPTTPGISQNHLRRLMTQALASLDAGDWLPTLPPACLPAWGKTSLKTALAEMHRPVSEDRWDGGEGARRRLGWEELLAHQLAFRRQGRSRRKNKAPPLVADPEKIRILRRSLPFRLTSAQERVIVEIQADLSRNRPMGRLLQGDVGSGKTVVAAHAALAAVCAGWQTALMAPTELLAEQHYRTWDRWLSPLDISTQLLTARQSGSKRKEILEAVAAGEVDVLLGTHALFQRDVSFSRLGLVIVDEQHRFGVDQRLALKAKADGPSPHYLVMTATPIPRTLALLRYADLEVSAIDELPPGREPVQTRVMGEDKRSELIERLRAWIGGGRQAYWVCTLIEASEVLAGEAAEKTAENLHLQLPEVRVGLVHGRMKAEVKDRTMAAFKAGEIDLLVATTVIEVGVDVPNAGLMVIENAERLGLAQLHQLRGRVGRGPGRSYCILLYKPPLAESARRRLAYLRECYDGFALAEKDLALRGPGEVLGTRQSGALRFRIADPLRDRDLLPEVRRAAEWLERHAPQTVDSLLAFWVEEGDRYANI